MTPRISSIMRLVSDRLGYCKQRHAERKERRADLRGYPIVHVAERLRQLQQRAHR